MVGIEAMREAHSLGIADFGENRARDFQSKSGQFGGAVTWHFIGSLQTNKVKYIIEHTHFIHSVDTSKLAVCIDEAAAKRGRKPGVLLEVHTGEDSKHGIKSERELLETAEACMALKNIRLCGLMTMAPFTDDETIVRQSFIRLRTMKDKLNERGFPVSELSMGMTGDFEIAIEEGATMVRIGTAIFGE
jgi:pyridoxal phosphate enzyme (YggS family)